MVDDLSTGRLENLRAVRSHPRPHVTVDSVPNYPMLNGVIGKVSEVVHLAAVVGVKRVLEEPVTTNAESIPKLVETGATSVSGDGM